MRVLIVDDEILVRVGLKTIIPWDKYGFELVGEASDGQEAIEMMERIPCDIVLTDIRMPRVDGLELIKLVKRRWPYTKCIILSSHSDFEYVQKALRIGAVDYLLKLTMEPQELVEKLLRIEKEIIRDLDKESENMQLKSKAMRYSIEVKEKRVRDILLKQCSKKEIAEVWEEFNLPSMKEAIVVANIQIDHYDQVLEENKFQSERLLNYTVANILSEILKKHDGGELVAVDHGVFSVIKEGMNYEMLGEMIRAVGSFIKLSITVGVSEPLDLIQGLNKAYQQADVALSYKFYEGCGQILSYDQVSYVPDNQLVLLWDEDIWIKMIERRDIYALLKGLEEMMTVCYGTIRTKPELMREQWFQLVNLFARYLPLKSSDIYSIPLFENQYPYHVIRNSETLTDIYDWFKGWIPLYLEYLKLSTGRRWRKEIQAVANMIQQQYHLPLKVPELAKEVGFTENYLSILFKKETGETIMDYITHTRMKKARELMKDPSFKIYEISEMVGYGDSNHFSKIFKRVEGVYPTEFRKMFLGR